ncbi:hypothetical protein FA95DRAFT_1497719 [Auriscalpium vulgare]|uniref:Uncharacterized protein n=1 Tax=Auriscalpium vulgare TaxID=40419 RepID=A0ACB8RKB8_9AGAM|nr:hypothetical protein FA95DRAFT_1497719 [Auriscalpium vulgare]
MVPPQLVQWLAQTYPKPQVDAEWLDACYNWVSTECGLNPATDMPAIRDQVEAQLLQSDLSDSMISGTGLPANVSELTGTNLRGPPTLVEIVDMTDIGQSAFSLHNVRQTRIDRADLAGLAEDDGGEDDGPVPRYPRSMLRLQLSDGTTTLNAIEFRKLPELELGETPLGYKVLYFSKRLLFFENT